MPCQQVSNISVAWNGLVDLQPGLSCNGPVEHTHHLFRLTFSPEKDPDLNCELFFAFDILILHFFFILTEHLIEPPAALAGRTWHGSCRVIPTRERSVWCTTACSLAAIHHRSSASRWGENPPRIEWADPVRFKPRSTVDTAPCWFSYNGWVTLLPPEGFITAVLL